MRVCIRSRLSPRGLLPPPYSLPLTSSNFFSGALEYLQAANRAAEHASQGALAQWIGQELVGQLRKSMCPISESRLSAVQLAQLVDMVEVKVKLGRGANVMSCMCVSGVGGGMYVQYLFRLPLYIYYCDIGLIHCGVHYFFAAL